MLPRSSSESLKETGWENDVLTIATTAPNPKIIELRGTTRSNEIRGSRKLYDDSLTRDFQGGLDQEWESSSPARSLCKLSPRNFASSRDQAAAPGR